MNDCHLNVSPVTILILIDEVPGEVLKIHNINTFVSPEDRVVNPIKCLPVICIVKIIAISVRANKTNDSVCKGNNIPPKSLIVHCRVLNFIYGFF